MVVLLVQLKRVPLVCLMYVIQQNLRRPLLVLKKWVCDRFALYPLVILVCPERIVVVHSL